KCEAVRLHAVAPRLTESEPVEAREPQAESRRHSAFCAPLCGKLRHAPFGSRNVLPLCAVWRGSRFLQPRIFQQRTSRTIHLPAPVGFGPVLQSFAPA